MDQIVFICATENYAGLRFARFAERPTGQPSLSVFGWDREQREGLRTPLEFNLPSLRMPPQKEDGEYDWDQARWHLAWDVERVTAEFFREYEVIFRQAEEMIQGVHGEKRLFTQGLFNRLMFVHFLSKKGWLRFNGREDYLAALWEGRDRDVNFYEAHLIPLFFAGLNNPQARDLNRNNPVLHSRIGDVPYLNGGLFESGSSDGKGEFIPDEAFDLIINRLFAGWNFTISESTPLDVEVAVDPEMLGKVFEELVTSRQETGSYYTPRSIVAFMCREALKGYLGGYGELIDDRSTDHLSRAQAAAALEKLQQVRVVDPACGSGAYLLGMLQELYALMGLLEVRADKLTARQGYQRRLTIIQQNLYGVDIDEFAVNIARLRLWLSLAVEYEGDDPQPLPNLDFKLEVGDSLTAPDPRGGEQLDIFRQDQITHFDALKTEYADPYWSGDKRALKNEVIELRDEIAAWVNKNGSLPKSAFDWRVEFAEVFRNAGFDIVLANPPYGEGSVTDELRDALFGPRSGQSKDIYSAFMARALQLLRPGGMMVYIISNTWRTIRTHRPLRKMLLQRTILHVTDVPEWVFKAVVRTCILALQNQPPDPGHRMIASDLAALPAGDWPLLDSNLLALAYHGPDLQTETYARYTYPQAQLTEDPNQALFVAPASLQRFVSDTSVPRLGESPAAVAKVAVGLQTGDNEYYLRVTGAGRGSYRPVDPDLVLTEEELRDYCSRPEEARMRGIAPEEYGGRHFIPYDKGGESDLEAGGWLPCYYVPTEYYIDWSRGAVQRLRTATRADRKRRIGQCHLVTPSDEATRAAVIRNSTLYFRKGITFSRTGRYAPTFRFNSSSVFDTEGSSLFPETMDPEVLVGILNSVLTRFVANVFLNNGWHTEVNDLKRLPIPNEAANASQLAESVRTIVTKQHQHLKYPYWQHEQRAIELDVFGLYGLSPDEVRNVELWFCRYERGRLAQARGWIAEAREKYADHLERCARILAGDPRRWRDDPLLALIAKGESGALEFKQSLEYVDAAGFLKMPEPQRQQKVAETRKAVIHSALKTVCAFLNSRGGTLLIGVHDSGEVIGIEPDYTLLGAKQNRDGFELKLTDLLKTRMEPIPAGLEIQFPESGGKTVCRIDVPASSIPHYLDNKLYVRFGNSTEELAGRDLEDWLATRAGRRT